MPQIINLYLKKIKASSQKRDIPNISEQNAEFLKNLIHERKPRHILEIGTANGYSTLCFAEVVLSSEFGVLSGEGIYPGIPSKPRTKNQEPSTTITTIDYAWNMHIEAVEYFKSCKLKNIQAIWGDAKAVIPTLADGYFDFVFIDAMKREYLDYLLLSLPKCTPDALIVIDDVEKFGHKMENLYTWIHENTIPYQIKKTDKDDSIMLIERKNLP